ncbi:MAG: hypothetical protein AAF615_03115, partial [Pseudomonadota bacterium]
MATDPTRSSDAPGSDASDVALNAVEEALKFDLGPVDHEPPGLASGIGQSIDAEFERRTADDFDTVGEDTDHAAAVEPAEPLLPANDSPEAAPASRLRRRRHRTAAKQQAAANDDRARFDAAASAGRRRGAATFGLATVAALIWAALGGLIFVASAGATGFMAFVTSPAALGVLAATVAPILLFFMVATLA